MRLNLTSHQIDLHELLISKLIRFWTVVNYPSPVGHEFQAVEPIRRVFYRRPEVSLRDVLVEVLGDIDDDALENWSVSLCPSPEHDKPERDTQLAPSYRSQSCQYRPCGHWGCFWIGTES